VTESYLPAKRALNALADAGSSGLDPAEWYDSYVATYVERDVRDVLNIGNLAIFQRFVRLCAGRTSQLLNLSSLGADTGMRHATAGARISVLVAKELGRSVPQPRGRPMYA
jgi:predicted AAA+ superfamily ATPase